MEVVTFLQEQSLKWKQSLKAINFCTPNHILSSYHNHNINKIQELTSRKLNSVIDRDIVLYIQRSEFKLWIWSI
jgi:hypothetical protein